MFVNDLFKLIENSNEEYYAVFNQRGKPMIMRKPAGKTAEAYAEEKNLTIKGGPFNSHKETESFWIRSVLPAKKEQDIEEAGPFSYGAKKPRKGSVADLAVQKRKEQERGKQPVDPRDQRVGTAKVVKEFLDDRNQDDDNGGDGRGRKSPKARARAQMLKMYGDGDITFRKTSNGGYFIQHEDDFGDTHSHQYDPQTGRVDFSSVTRSSYYGEGVAEGSDNITAVFSGYGNYMSGRGSNVFKHYGITVLDKQYFEDEDIAEYTVSGSKEALDQARAYLERSDQFGGMIIKQGVAEGGFDIPEIPRAPQPRPEPKNKTVGEGSVQDKLHKRHQELRKKRGAPDPEYYRELKATFDLPDEERFAKAAELKKKYKVSEARKSEVNFDIEDIKKLERIRDLPTLKAQAMALISKPSERPMKPEKVAWFDAALDRMDSPLKIIKLMYDLLLSGEGHQVIGSKRSMNPNSYRDRFGESSDGSIKYEFTLANGKKDYQTSKPAKAGDKAAVDVIGAKTIYKANNPLQKIKSIRVVDKPKDEESKIKNEDRERYIEELERAGYEIVTESATLCPECGGAAYADQMLAEKQDACYHKVKSRYKVWPSAYASGALVRCRKKGAANWGNKSKK